jgi:hypothetical protein
LQTVPRAGRVRKHTNWWPTSRRSAAAPGTKRETASKLGNKKWALAANLHVIDTAIGVKYISKDTAFGAVGTAKHAHAVRANWFMNKLGRDTCWKTRRKMHQTVELQRIRKADKSREANASKVEDGAPAPVHSTFIELALRPKTVRSRDV